MDKHIKGLIFGIQHFCIHDGEGIRSNVFLKGCPLQCLWCHNPEGLAARIELQYFENRCRQSGRCREVFKDLKAVSGESDSVKERYAENCPYGALELVGSYMTADEVLYEVQKDQAFFCTSKGGITLSGGEPMMQTDFVLELLKKAKEAGLSTAIETSGYSDQKNFERIYPYVDEFLWDFKETDRKKHAELTGADNRKILENLKFLCGKGASVTLRCPVIPGVNDTEEHFQGIADLLNRMSDLKGWEIMPYHRLGSAKVRRLSGENGTEYSVPSQETVRRWKEIVIKYQQKRNYSHINEKMCIFP